MASTPTIRPVAAIQQDIASVQRSHNMALAAVTILAVACIVMIGLYAKPCHDHGKALDKLITAYGQDYFVLDNGKLNLAADPVLLSEYAAHMKAYKVATLCVAIPASVITGTLIGSALHAAIDEPTYSKRKRLELELQQAQATERPEIN